ITLGPGMSLSQKKFVSRDRVEACLDRLLRFTNSNRFGQALVRVTRRDELVADKAAVAGRLERAHHAWVVDFLIIVEFSPSRVAGRVNVPDQSAVLPDTADQVAVHHLHVIAIEQELHIRQADTLDDSGAIVQVVTMIARMPLHWMRTVARVQVLETNRYIVCGGILSEMLQTRDAIRGALVA